MKVILSYGSYFNHGKKYQVKFIYDNQIEIESINDLMNKLKSTKLFNFYFILSHFTWDSPLLWDRKE